MEPKQLLFLHKLFPTTLFVPPTQCIIDAYKSKLVRGSRKLLTLFLYNSSEEIRLFLIHPEMLQVDTTHSRNED